MSSVRSAAFAALLAGTALCAGLANAQVYRITGPDGKVTFSDRPPPDAKATPAQTVAIGGNGGTAALPTELRNAASKYPVTLYTASNCAPCDSGRAFLRQRGIPYTENTVGTRDDIAALQRLSGASNLPFMTIGAQHVPGFSESEWSQYFDAAGYPKTSQLPPAYRNPEPKPLVAVQEKAPATTARTQRPPQEQPRADATPPASNAPNPNNPAGIRF